MATAEGFRAGDPAGGSEFGAVLRRLRSQRRLTLRALARLAHIDPGHLSKLENGQRPPTPALADSLDSALDADGAVVAAAGGEDPCVRESNRLAALLSGAGTANVVERIGEDTFSLAVDYLSTPPSQVLVNAAQARRAAWTQWQSRRLIRPADANDMVGHLGRLSGILAYAALDTGRADHARGHIEAAWYAAESTGDDTMRAWVRGTQSLIARFTGHFPFALELASDGLRYAHNGQARARLLCGVAQCHANLGDREAMLAAIRHAADEALEPVDGMPGMLGFTEAKRAYYSASSMMWSAPDDAPAAADAADRAVRLWRSGDPSDRSTADELLAHVYAATAALTMHDLDLAAQWLAPVLDLPDAWLLSWLRKRLANAAHKLSRPPYDSDHSAAGLRDRIRAVTVS